MIKKIIAIVALAAVSAGGSAFACTSLIAAPGATKEGSSMVTYAADSHVLYGELYNQPAAVFQRNIEVTTYKDSSALQIF